MQDKIEENNLILELGNRHLMDKQDNKFEINGIRESVRIGLSISNAVAKTLAGQFQLSMTLNLLARLFGLIKEIVLINVPDIKVSNECFHLGYEPNLLERLKEMTSLISSGKIKTITENGISNNLSAVIIIGDQEIHSSCINTIGTIASGWNLYVGKTDDLPKIIPDDSNPIGPYFAACITVAEVYKIVRKMKTNCGYFAEHLFLSIYDLKNYTSWDDMPHKSYNKFEFKSAYLVGAGAVGQAFALTIGSLNNIHGYITIIDDDCLDITNQNRYCLSAYESSYNKEDKVSIIGSYLQSRGIKAYPFKGKWEDYVTCNNEQPNEEVRVDEKRNRYPLVISCVDINSARHSIQNYLPQYILGGSTLDFAITTILYRMDSTFECLKCFNPIEPKNETIEVKIEEIKNMTEDERKDFAKNAALNYEELMNHLSQPKCGTLSEQMINKFLDKSEVDWTIGFVSVASGVLLASRFLLLIMEGEGGVFPEKALNAIRYNLLNLKGGCSCSKKRSDCSCREDIKLYKKIWY